MNWIALFEKEYGGVKYELNAPYSSDMGLAKPHPLVIASNLDIEGIIVAG